MGLTFISSQTASTSSSIDFTSGIDGTYNEYLFTMVNFKPVTDEKRLCFQVDTGTATTYGQTITSLAFSAAQNLAGSWSLLEYNASDDQAQGTALQHISYSGESNSFPDMSVSGQLTLYDPSSSTFVKHFMSRSNVKYTGNGADNQTYSIELYTAGYINTTTALTRVRFAAQSGNIYTGTFTLYGVG
jgi:hypothetical protein